MGNHDCPTCSRTFDTRRGLGVHHSHAHDERLPNRVCDRCGDEFYSEYEQKYCSEACRSQAVSFEGADNPNYSGGKTTTACEICGDTFEYYPSDKKGLYCPDCVESEAWRETPTVEGPDHPMWKGGRVELECEVCSEPLERYPSQIYGDIVVCSDACKRDWLSTEFTGEGHPNWKGGSDFSYGPGWNEVRRKALERDDYTCVVCGTTSEDLGRNPDVHHLIPVRVFRAADDYEVADAHFLDNVVSLCPACHRKAEFGEIPRRRLRAGASTTA